MFRMVLGNQGLVEGGGVPVRLYLTIEKLENVTYLASVGTDRRREAWRQVVLDKEGLKQGHSMGRGQYLAHLHTYCFPVTYTDSHPRGWSPSAELSAFLSCSTFCCT